MANCKNKIKKKQIDWIPYTTDDDEFCTISPGGSSIPTLDDYILIEDASEGNEKACVKLSDLGALFSSSVGRVDDTFLYGDNSNSFKDKFLPAGESQNPSNQSSPLAITDGEIQIIVVSNNSDSNNFYIEIVQGAYDGLGGTYSGGTLLHSEYFASGAYDRVFNVNVPVDANERIAVYIRSGSGPQNSANKPLVKLYLKYDSAIPV